MRCSRDRFSGSFPVHFRPRMAKATTLNKEQKRQLLLTMLESRHGDLREESLNRQGKGHFHVSGRINSRIASFRRKAQCVFSGSVRRFAGDGSANIAHPIHERTEIVTTRTSLPGFDQCELTHAAAAQGGVLH